MKKLLSLVIAIALTVSSLGIIACNNSEGETPVNKAVTYTIATQVNDNAAGTINVDNQTVDFNGSAIVRITANSGYVLKDILVNGTSAYDSMQANKRELVLTGILRDYTVRAVFIKATATLKFTGSDAEDMDVAYGASFGELPVAYETGKKFVAWKDANGNRVDEETKVDVGGDIILTPEFTDLTEREIDGLKPFSSTTVYYDMTATKYGVSWHTAVKPVNPRIQVVNGTKDAESDFVNAEEYVCSVKPWMPMGGDWENDMEYIVTAVLDNLDFETAYSVRFGDASAEQWSNVYHFTTRVENKDATNFLFITDTQQRNHLGVGDSAATLTTHWEQVMREATQRHDDIDFVIHGGDLIDRGEYPSSNNQEAMSSMEKWLFELPVMPIAGNHEDPRVGDGNGYGIINNLYNIQYPDMIVNGNYDFDKGPIYSFEVGPVHFVMLSSNEIFYYNEGNYQDANGDKRQLSKLQTDWMQYDIAQARTNPNIKWIIAVMHEGLFYPYSVNDDGYRTGGNYSADNESVLISQLLPMFTSSGVDLVLYGHGHQLMCSYPVYWNEEIETPADFTFFTNASKMTKSAAEGGYTNKDYQAYRKTDYVTQETRVASQTVNKWGETETIDEFVYPANSDLRGTVCVQMATSGNQTSETTPKEIDFMRIPVITGGGRTGDYFAGRNATSMYGYVTVTANELCFRTYGVRVRQIADRLKIPEGENVVAVPYTDNGTSFTTSYFIDGFRLTK